MTDLCGADAVTLAGMLRRREVSAREVMAAHIQRIEAVDGGVNAMDGGVSAVDSGVNAVVTRTFDAALAPPPIAFMPPSTASIRWMWAAMTSRADTSRRRSIPASVTASAPHKSVTGCSLGRLAVPPVGGHPQFD